MKYMFSLKKVFSQEMNHTYIALYNARHTFPCLCVPSQK